MARPGVEDEPGLVPAPVVTLGAPRFLPGTAFSGFGIFGSKALFWRGGGGGFFVRFLNGFKTGTLFLSGGTTSSFLCLCESRVWWGLLKVSGGHTSIHSRT